MSRSSLHLIYRLTTTLLLVFLISATFTTHVHAAGSDDDGIIEAGEVIYDDVFLNGTNVRMDGAIEGNLLAAGESITINGTVSGDVFLFSREVIVGDNAVIEGNLFSGAQSLRIEGQINGSLAVGASAMELAGADISGNVYYGGFHLETDSDTFIGVDLFAGGYQIILNGEVGRDVAAAVAAAEINGTVNRDVTLEMGDSEPNPLQFPAPPGVEETLQPGLRVGAAAMIGGDLKYTNPTDQSARIQAEPGGQIIYQTPVPGGQAEPLPVPTQTNPLWMALSTAWGVFMNFWKHFFSLIIVGTLVVLVFPGLLKSAVTSLKTQPLGSVGFGVLTLILGYAAIILLVLVVLAVSILFSILSVGGLRTATFGLGLTGVSFISTIFTMLVVFGSKIVVATLVGTWILTRLAPESRALETPFWSMALGVLLYAILRIIPVIGWLLAAIVIVLGLGAIWLSYRRSSQASGLPVG